MKMMLSVYLVRPKMMIMRFGDGGEDDDDGGNYGVLCCVLMYDDGLNQNDLCTNRIMDQRVTFGARAREEQKL